MPRRQNRLKLHRSSGSATTCRQVGRRPACSESTCGPGIRGLKGWSANGSEAVRLVVRAHGEMRDSIPLPHDVPVGGEVTLTLPMLVPPLLFKSSEQVVLTFELMRAGEPISLPLAIQVKTGPPESGATAESLQVFGVACCPSYLPSGGVSRSRDGRPFPLFAKAAQGCRIRDVEGNQWIDYVMGWVLPCSDTPERRSAMPSRRSSSMARFSHSRTHSRSK